MNLRTKWLKNAIFYQIYPTSFYDSDGDGVGDLRGIARKLDYVKSLGCDGIWLNPVFRSPFRDGGYDISDYLAVDERFGTFEDAKALFSEAKKRGIRILLDLVPGHTSDRHPWFLRSQRAERNAYSDYYIWTDSVWTEARAEPGINGGLPRTVNGMCERDGNYLVNFFSMQPALNFGYADPTEKWQMDWRDERLLPLKRELLGIIRFWLRAGCSGFRVDMAFSLVKNDPDGRVNAQFWREILGEVHREFPEAIFVSEWSDPARSVGEGGFDADFLLHFGDEAYTSLFRYEEKGKESCFRKGSKQSFRRFYDYFQRMSAGLNGNGYMAIPSGNHDMRRISLGRSEEEVATAMAFLFTVPAIPFLYYGDEVFLKYRVLPTKDGGYDRTGSRTPMQWTAGKNRGFSYAQTLYLPVDGEPGISVEEMEARPGSLLHVVRELSALRRGHAALGAGTEMAFLGEEPCLVYDRTDGSETIRIFLNVRGNACAASAEGYDPLMTYGAELTEGTLRFRSVGFAVLKRKI